MRGIEVVEEKVRCTPLLSKLLRRLPLCYRILTSLLLTTGRLKMNAKIRCRSLGMLPFEGAVDAYLILTLNLILAMLHLPLHCYILKATPL